MFSTTSASYKSVSNYKVNREVGVLKNILNVVVEWRRLKTNPIRATKKLKEPPGRLRFLSLEETGEGNVGSKTTYDMTLLGADSVSCFRTLRPIPG